MCVCEYACNTALIVHLAPLAPLDSNISAASVLPHCIAAAMGVTPDASYSNKRVTTFTRSPSPYFNLVTVIPRKAVLTAAFRSRPLSPSRIRCTMTLFLFLIAHVS